MQPWGDGRRRDGSLSWQSRSVSRGVVISEGVELLDLMGFHLECLEGRWGDIMGPRRIVPWLVSTQRYFLIYCGRYQPLLTGCSLVFTSMTYIWRTCRKEGNHWRLSGPIVHCDGCITVGSEAKWYQKRATCRIYFLFTNSPSRKYKDTAVRVKIPPW